MKQLDTIDHVAIQVTDLARAIAWYTEQFKAEVVYEDPTWAMLKFANIHLALVTPEQHPPHIALQHTQAEKFGELTKHRDETLSVYIKDSEGNTVEIMQKDTASK